MFRNCGSSWVFSLIVFHPHNPNKPIKVKKFACMMVGWVADSMVQS